MKDTSSLQIVDEKIHTLRGHKVILAHDLATLYGVPTKRLNEQVRRNRSRFPADFVFRLAQVEMDTLGLRSQIATSKKRGGIRYSPYAFTEHGAMMAANVLKSQKAVQMSIFVVRAFSKLREMVNTHRDLASKLKELEQRVGEHDTDIQGIIKAIQRLLIQEEKPKRRMGFHHD